MLKYHDDGKGKWQSHEVWVEKGSDSAFNDISKGYGATFEEALHEYKKNVEKAKNELYSVNLDKEKAVAVRFDGKPITAKGTNG